MRNETTTLETVAHCGPDVVAKRKLKAFLLEAVAAGVIPPSFFAECEKSAGGFPPHGGRCKWGSRTFPELRSLYLHCHPKTTSELKTTAPWIARKIALAEDRHAGFDDSTAGTL